MEGIDMLVIPNRVKVIAVMVTALALAAGLLTLALLAKPAQAQADTTRVNDRIPFTGTLTNPCTEEAIFFEGTIHFVFHTTEDASGGFHSKGHFDLQVQGESASGAKYLSPEVDNQQSFTAFSESPNNFTLERTVLFIRQGETAEEDDFQFKTLSHVTVNANGEITSVVDEESEVFCI
jgi:hypothetical protein